MYNRILFVCSGNLCRSPAAAKMFIKLLKREGIEDVEVLSAGTIAIQGDPASSVACETALKMGLDLSDHSSQPTSPELLRSCDLILVMDLSHLISITGMCPDVEPRVRLLRSFAPQSAPNAEIADPMGLPPLAFRTCFANILESLGGLLKEIKNERSKPD
jgi:protein-tyrosine phosphatase